MRTLTAPLQARLSSRFAEEPLIILQVNWGAPVGIRYYGDKAFVAGSFTVEARVRDMGAVVAQLGVNDVGSVNAVSVTLLDPKKELHAFSMTNSLERKAARILIGFEGLADTDYEELYAGTIGSPIVWNEAERLLSFEVVSPTDSKTIGNLYLEADLALDPLYQRSIVGQIPPVVFGAPKAVPALRIKAAIRGVLGVDVTNSTAAFGVIGGSFFPAGLITIRVGNEFMTGSFFGDLFTPTARNVSKNNLTFTGRLVDEDSGNPHSAYISAAFTNEPLPGNAIQLLKFGQDIPYAHIVEKRNTRIRMDRPASRIDSSSGAETFFLVDGTYLANVRGFNPNERWAMDAGTSVTQVGAEGDTYALDSSTTVVRVLAKRSSEIYDPHAGTHERLTEVPSTLYTVGVGPKGEVTIVFPKALSELGQGWQDGSIFVDCTSTRPTHPADVIKHILQTWTDLIVDSPSFATAKTQIGNSVVVAFAQLSPDDALQVAQDLAWQVRSALVILGRKVFLRFLDKAPVASGTEFTVDDTSVKEASIELTATDLDEVYTVLKAIYQESYDLPEITLMIEKNVSTYGRRVLEKKFFAFQDRTLVNTGATFWSKRYARPWRVVRLTSFNLAPLAVELLDPVLFALSDILSLRFYAEAREVSHDTAEHAITFRLWCPIEVGTLVISGEAYSS